MAGGRRRGPVLDLRSGAYAADLDARAANWPSGPRPCGCCTSGTVDGVQPYRGQPLQQGDQGPAGPRPAASPAPDRAPPPSWSARCGELKHTVVGAAHRGRPGTAGRPGGHRAVAVPAAARFAQGWAGGFRNGDAGATVGEPRLRQGSLVDPRTRPARPAPAPRRRPSPLDWLTLGDAFEAACLLRCTPPPTAARPGAARRRTPPGWSSTGRTPRSGCGNYSAGWTSRSTHEVAVGGLRRRYELHRLWVPREHQDAYARMLDAGWWQGRRELLGGPLPGASTGPAGGW